jgi:hypothetical protein
MPGNAATELLRTWIPSVPEGPAALFILLILIVGIFCLFVELYSTTRYQIDIRQYANPIDTLYKLRTELELRRDQFSVEAHWTWACDHLLYTATSTHSIRPRRRGEKLLLVRYPIALAQSVPPLSPVRFAPALLTAIGVLGTFYGVAKALQATSVGEMNAEQLRETSALILGGMRTAFDTSLWGLSFAALMMVALAIGGNVRRWSQSRLRRQFNNLAIRVSPVELLAQLDPRANQTSADRIARAAEALQAAAAGMQEASNQVSVGITQLITTQQALTPEAIGRQVGGVVGAVIQRDLAPVFQEIRDELTALREIKADQGQEVMRELIRELREEVLEPMAERLDKSAAMTQRASEAVEKLHHELGGISKELAESVVTIQQFQTKTLNQLLKFAQYLKKIFTDFQQETKGVLEKVAEEIQRAVEESIKGLEAQRGAFEESATQAAQTFRGIREDLAMALKEQAQREQEMLEGVRERTESILERSQQAFEQQSATLMSTGAQAATLMDAAREELEAGLAGIHQQLQDTRKTVQEELERFQLAYQESLNAFFEQQNNLLEETLGRQREGLAGVVSDLQSAFADELLARQELADRANQTLERFQTSAEVTHELIEVAGLSASGTQLQLQEAARQIGDAAGRVDRTYRDLTTQLQQTLVHSNQALSDYLSSAHTSQQAFFTEMDKASARISDRLLSAATYLVAAEQHRRTGEAPVDNGAPA